MLKDGAEVLTADVVVSLLGRCVEGVEVIVVVSTDVVVLEGLFDVVVVGELLVVVEDEDVVDDGGGELDVEGCGPPEHKYKDGWSGPLTQLL